MDFQRLGTNQNFAFVVLLLLASTLIVYLAKIEPPWSKALLWCAFAIASPIFASYFWQRITSEDGKIRWPIVGIILATIIVILIISRLPEYSLYVWDPKDLYSLETDVTTGKLTTNSKKQLELIVDYQRVALLFGTALILLTIQLLRRNKISRFVDGIGLISASIPSSTPEYINRFQCEVARYIKPNKHVRAVFINGTEDLLKETSEIRRKILETKPKVNVLILSPFSIFTKERARLLRWKDDGAEQSYLRYIHEFSMIRKELKKWAESFDVTYRVYCSRPLHRFYHICYQDLSTDEATCVSQYYLTKEHGYQSPYQVFSKTNSSKPSHCFSDLTLEAFQYLWDGGFDDFSEESLMDRDSLVIYMADLNNIKLKDGDGLRPIDEIRKDLLKFVNDEIARAKLTIESTTGS